MSSSSNFQFWIVTPSYNQAHFITQTIESILSQAADQLRYVVTDGGSNDETVKLLKGYGSQIEWVSERDAGQTDAINKGFKILQKNASAQKTNQNQVIVAYLNSDDYYLPDTFKTVSQAFNRNPDRAWLVGDCQIIDQDNRLIQEPIRIYKQFLRRFCWPWSMAITNPVPQPAVFIRLSALTKTGSFNPDLRYVMDYEYWLRLLTEVGQPIRVSQQLAAFRIHGQSKGGSQFAQQFTEELQVARRFFSNPLLLFLHRLHTLLIVSIYRVIK